MGGQFKCQYFRNRSFFAQFRLYLKMKLIAKFCSLDKRIRGAVIINVYRKLLHKFQTLYIECKIWCIKNKIMNLFIIYYNSNHCNNGGNLKALLNDNS